MSRFARLARRQQEAGPSSAVVQLQLLSSPIISSCDSLIVGWVSGDSAIALDAAFDLVLLDAKTGTTASSKTTESGQ